jgi:hypothetical protein
MGRAKNPPKKISFKTKQAIELWEKNRSNPRWKNLKDYDSKRRLWVKMINGGIAMVDSESYIDIDGTELYRVVYFVDDEGFPILQYNQIRVFLNNRLRCVSHPVIDVDTSLALDQWIKSAKEHVDHIWYINPCRVLIPGHIPWIIKPKRVLNLMNMSGANWYSDKL